MRPSDANELARRLANLADALGGKAPGAAGLAVWMDTLAECDASDVWGVLIDWPKSRAKMPLPTEVLKLAREVASERRERIAKAEARIGQTFDVAAIRGDLSCPAYAAFRDAVVRLRRTPKPQPKAWAYALRDRENRGEFLFPVQRENWRAALRETTRAGVESMTEDELEALRERDAMRAESAPA